MAIRMSPKWKKRAVRWGIGGGIAFVVGSVLTVEATSKSWFCNSCHVMEPFYDSWKTSAHDDVECVKCHITPGAQNFLSAKLNGLGQVVDDVLNRTSNKPSAAVSQMACLRSGCHSVETISSHKLETEKFRFSHAAHIDQEHLGVPISCTTCHSHVKGDEHFEVNTGVCINCHLVETETPRVAATLAAERVETSSPLIRMAVREGHLAIGENGRPPSNCSACHNPPDEPFEYQGLTVDHTEYISFGAACESCHRGTTATPQPIDDGACLSCHIYGVEEVLPVEEMHKVHAEGRHKIECFSCHGTIRHGPTSQIMTLERLDCRNCHTGQHEIQRSTYLHEADHAAASSGSTVSPMFMAHVDCTGCHVQPTPLTSEPGNGARVARPTAAACDSCHQPGLGDQMIPLWQTATHELYDDAMRQLESVEARDLTPEQQTLVAAAREMIEVVRMDGSWGVHNPYYTQQILERARETLRAAAQASDRMEGL
jgi:nitrate/TMAO reductase-like tetraheme cytochrome c subunit